MVIINNDYKVDVDENTLTLIKTNGMKISKKYGTEYESTTIIGYYTSWESIFTKLANLFIAERVKKQDQTSLAELQNMYIEVANEIKTLCKTLKK